MPCLHKFFQDLNLERIDFQPTILIVGTFNPGWDDLGNSAPWFYGRTRNNYFWEVLPRLYGGKSLRQAAPAEWKAFCKQYQIALTDLIASIDDADSNNPTHVGYLKNYRDDSIARHFKDFIFVDIPNLLVNKPTITQVYLTRNINDPFWRRLWQPVNDYCLQHDVKNQTLLTPSGSARFQMPKHPKISLGDFIYEQWCKADIRNYCA
jgi:hypothetical protein